MDYIVSNLSKLIKNSPIDIDAVNEFLKRGNKNFGLIIKENGDIVKVEKDESEKSLFGKIKNGYIFIKNLILKLLGLIEVQEKANIHGLINIRNNCYLNAGLQILARCYPLVMELLDCNCEKNDLLKSFLNTMLLILFTKNKLYNPTEFMECFCKTNKEFVIGQQNCSQNFIRTILKNVNNMNEKVCGNKYYFPTGLEKEQYERYIKENNILPESKAYSFFSGIQKIKLEGECPNCKNKILNYSFNSFVDQTIYLDAFYNRCYFSDVLKMNIGQKNKSLMKCPECQKKFYLNTVSSFVKIPEIFIFTLERYLIRNKVPVEPDDNINIYKYVDECLDCDKGDCNYELFAINIRIGEDLSSGHEICQVKEKEKWYTINDNSIYIKKKDFNEYSYGLFYRKVANKKINN